MGQQISTEKRGYSFFVHGLGSIAFFIRQKLGSPPAQHLHQSLCPKSIRTVLNRWRCKLTLNGNRATSTNVSFISCRSHLQHWLLSTPPFCSFHAFICLQGDMSYLGIPQASFNSWQFQQTSKFRIGWLKWHPKMTFTSILRSMQLQQSNVVWCSLMVMHRCWTVLGAQPIKSSRPWQYVEKYKCAQRKHEQQQCVLPYWYITAVKKQY